MARPELLRPSAAPPTGRIGGAVALALAVVYLVWGSTYFFILLALKGFTPMILGGFRFIVAGLIMLLYCAIRGEKIFV